MQLSLNAAVAEEKVRSFGNHIQNCIEIFADLRIYCVHHMCKVVELGVSKKLFFFFLFSNQQEEHVASGQLHSMTPSAAPTER